MSEKIYLHLLILCGVFSQGIIATLSNNDPNSSSDLLSRKRRVINNLPHGSTAIRIENVNYIVNIRESNRAVCAGVILSHFTVITAATCIKYHESDYTVSAGSAYYQRNSLHNVTSQVKHYGNPPHQHYDGIALLAINPPFAFGPRIRNINLYIGPLPTGTHVTVFGWGFSYPPQPAPRESSRRVLRSITLPIMDHGMCQNVYREHYRQLQIHNSFAITEKHICTYDEHQYTARTDTGAPLVVNNLLAGILAWKGEFPGGRNPDVFIDLHRPEYIAWIRENIRYF